MVGVAADRWQWCGGVVTVVSVMVCCGDGSGGWGSGDEGEVEMKMVEKRWYCTAVGKMLVRLEVVCGGRWLEDFAD
ncbi:hypothetical protein Tco_0017965 [Tanacetum coccineum]